MMFVSGQSKNKKKQKNRNHSAASTNSLRQTSTQRKIDPREAAAAFAKVMAGNVPAISCIAKHLITASPSLMTASLEESLPKAFDFDANLKIKEMDFVESCRRLADARTDVEAHPSALCPYWSIRTSTC